MASLKPEKILIVFNPAAGKSQINKLNMVIRQLEEQNIQVSFAETKYAGHAREIAGNVDAEQYDMVVVGGGDGTINEVINGLYPSKIPLGIIPLGTANVVASEMGLENNVPAIVDYIINGEVKPCWLGNLSGRYFLLMVSVGLDAKAVATVSRKLKKYTGKFAYFVSFMKSLLTNKTVEYSVLVDGKEFKSSSVIVSKGQYYGGKYLCAPDTNLQQRNLQVLLTNNRGMLNFLWYAILMFTQKFPYANSVVKLTGQHVEITSDCSNDPVQMDGDMAGELPKSVSISDDYIHLLYPASPAD